jgi:hypothetical protein
MKTLAHEPQTLAHPAPSSEDAQLKSLMHQRLERAKHDVLEKRDRLLRARGDQRAAELRAQREREIEAARQATAEEERAIQARIDSYQALMDDLRRTREETIAKINARFDAEAPAPVEAMSEAEARAARSSLSASLQQYHRAAQVLMLEDPAFEPEKLDIDPELLVEPTLAPAPQKTEAHVAHAAKPAPVVTGARARRKKASVPEAVRHVMLTHGAGGISIGQIFEMVKKGGVKANLKDVTQAVDRMVQQKVLGYNNDSNLYTLLLEATRKV